MNTRSQHGATLVVGLTLLALVTLLGLAGATTAHVEAQLAHNEHFRENAASAASAGVEYAIRSIVTTSAPAAVPSTIGAMLTGSSDQFDARTRFLGLDTALPRAPGDQLVGEQYEIISTGFSSRGAVDRQRAIVMRVVASADIAESNACEPELAGVRCRRAGDLVRLSWQRVSP